MSPDKATAAIVIGPLTRYDLQRFRALGGYSDYMAGNWRIALSTDKRTRREQLALLADFKRQSLSVEYL